MTILSKRLDYTSCDDCHRDDICKQPTPRRRSDGSHIENCKFDGKNWRGRRYLRGKIYISERLFYLGDFNETGSGRESGRKRKRKREKEKEKEKEKERISVPKPVTSAQ